MRLLFVFASMISVCSCGTVSEGKANEGEMIQADDQVQQSQDTQLEELRLEHIGSLSPITNECLVAITNRADQYCLHWEDNSSDGLPDITIGRVRLECSNKEQIVDRLQSNQSSGEYASPGTQNGSRLEEVVDGDAHNDGLTEAERNCLVYK